MGFAVELLLYKVKSSVSMNSDSVQTLYACVASSLGFDSMLEEPSINKSLCPNCTLESCVKNDTCLSHRCSSFYTDFGAIFASFSFLLLLISSIQLILVMVHDSLQDIKQQPRWKKAFRVTVQKCLLGAVILATGSRAIYYTIQSLIPDKWGDILLNVYYPSLLSAISLLICFWAEFFYTSSNLEGQDFLRKYRYFVSYLSFSILVFLLLIADIIATPLISDQEQIQMSGIIGIIFAFFLFMTLVGFLHFAIRLFFRPDWQPLFVQLAVLRINLRQQLASVLGVVSNALMQSLIIALLIFNMVVRYFPVDSYNLYICAVVIRVTELVMPLWFCCSLWNFKQPKSLWILNPGLILKLEQHAEDVESKPLLEDQSGQSGQSDRISQYGAISSDGDSVSRISLLGDEGCCWVCQGNDDPSDLFYPCNCQLHRKCIKQWVAKRASNTNISQKEYMRCQVCGKQYKTVKRVFTCFPSGMQRRHWLQLVGAGVFVLCSVVGLVFFGLYAPIATNKRVFIMCSVAVCEAIVVKFLGIRMALVLRKGKSTQDIQGLTVEEWKRKKAKENRKLLQVAYQSRGGHSSASRVQQEDSANAAKCNSSNNNVGVIEVIVSDSETRSIHSTVSIEITPSRD